LGGKSLARMLSAWRGFFSYLMRDHQCQGNPCMGLRAPKSARNLPHALSPDEAVRMVELPTTDGILAVRDKAMFELFYSSGLRLAELVDLDPGALDFADAVHVFAGLTFELEDTRRDYGETRIICFGYLAARMVVVGYTPRGAVRHVFSMSKANEHEQARIAPLLEV